MVIFRYEVDQTVQRITQRGKLSLIKDFYWDVRNVSAHDRAILTLEISPSNPVIFNDSTPIGSIENDGKCVICPVDLSQDRISLELTFTIPSSITQDRFIIRTRLIRTNGPEHFKQVSLTIKLK
jgi:hypothetical protein